MFFDCCALAMCVISIKKLFVAADFYGIAFVIISVAAAAVAAAVTVQTVKNGVIFNESAAEFTLPDGVYPLYLTFKGGGSVSLLSFEFLH